MGFIDKLKNVFFEEVEEEEEEVKEEPLKLAKKIEIPKRKERVIERKDTSDEFFNDDKVVINNRVDEISVQVPEEKNEPIIEEDFAASKIPMMFEEEDFFDNTYKEEVQEDVRTFARQEKTEKKELYQGKKEPSYVESVSKTTAYTYTKSYYDNKESKGFKPSPIISPIYGVLDKNYRKEEVVTKKEVKPSSNSYRKVDLDSVRNKAFGTDVKEAPKSEKVKEVKQEYKREEKTLYDVNKAKPDVDKITLADADEYYNDLGLAYNVDYNDASRTIPTTRTKRYHEEVKEENDGNDNLFDLIDLMYNKED